MHGRTQVACCLRERRTLLAGRTVAEEAYRVQCLTGAASGNDHEATGQRATQRFGCASLARLTLTQQRRGQRRRTRRRHTLLLRARVQGLSRRVTGRVHRVHLALREARDHIQRDRENILRLRHATRARIRARQTPNRRLNHVITPRTQRLHVRLSRRMLPHLGVHRRRQNHRGVRRQHRRGQQIIRTTSRQTSQQISGRRGNHHSVSLLSLTHMVHLRHTVKYVRRDGVAAQRLQSGNAHELRRVRGGHGDYLVAILRKKTKEHRRLIRSNAPSNTNDNAHGTSKNPCKKQITQRTRRG